jgi:hypothetical protein
VDYLAGMDWQQPVALGIVAAAALSLAWRKFRPRRFSFERDTHCGCPSPTETSPQSSIVFHARKDGHKSITVKNR